MADRYWVLGTGSWSSTNTANWSASSGGAGGASVPTASDNVFFDANSNVGTGAFTVTMANSPRVCNDFTASGLDGTMTLAGSSIGLTVSGSLTFQATNFTRSYTGTTTFNATSTGKTVTSNGKTFGAVTFDGVGGGWTLGSNLNCGINTVTVTNGTFDTSSVGNYAINAGTFSSSNSNIRTINLNASTVNVDGFSFTTSTNLTFNAGTSQININSNTSSINLGGKTFHNFSFTSNGATTTSFSIDGANTFNNFSIVGRTAPGLTRLIFFANQTINGTLNIGAGATASCRTFLRSNSLGTQRTLTVNAISSLTDIDFRDIVAAGASGTWSGTRLGNCVGNGNITFAAGKTVYYRQTGSANWGATGTGSWSATSGGALDATMFPLAQDTAIFPASTYPASGSTTTINGDYNIGTIDMLLRTSNTMTLLITNGLTIIIYGNWSNGTGITISGTGAINFSGRTTQQITSVGIPFPSNNFLIDSPTGTLQLQDALTLASSRFTTLTSGTLDLQLYTLSTGTFTSNSVATRTIAFGTGNITCTSTGSTVWNTGTTLGLTTTGTGTISLTSASAKTFAGGSFSYSGITLNQGGAGALTITGSNTFSNITNTVQPATVLFTAGTTSTFSNFSLSGTSGNLITIGSVTAASHTLSKASGTVSVSNCSISQSSATGGATWESLTTNGNVDGGNNTGWIFTAVAPSTGNFLVFF